jgi:hypothetical protein
MVKSSHARFLSLSCFLILFALSGCSTVPKEMNFGRAKQIVEFGEQYFLSLEGRPLSEEVKPIENIHVKGQIDEWHIVTYDGCIASYYRVVPEKRNILSSLTLTSQKVQLPHGIHIGVRKSFILNLLGKPTHSSWDEITYECGDAYSETVSFKFSWGALSQISWYYEID